MNANALGLIEVIGYPAALEAADTCVKSSHVKLLGYEKALDGRIVVKISGDVGAVKAAVEGAKTSAGRLGTVIAAIVIARPAEGISALIHSPETVFADTRDTLPLQEEREASPLPELKEGFNEAELTPEGESTPEESGRSVEVTEAEAETGAESELVAETEPGTELEPVTVIEPEPVMETEPVMEPQPELVQPVEAAAITRNEVTCNLCGDSLCLRIKGQPASLCLHYQSRAPKNNKDGQH